MILKSQQNRIELVTRPDVEALCVVRVFDVEGGHDFLVGIDEKFLELGGVVPALALGVL